MTAELTAAVSIPNFRDVGGHTTADGRRVRSGRLYRSVALDAASDDDLMTLASLGIATVFDMRRPEEQSLRPDRMPAGAELVSLDVFADAERGARADIGAVIAHLREPDRVDTRLTVEDMDRFQADSYYDLVTLDGELLLHNFEKRPVKVRITNPVPGKPLRASEEGHLQTDPTKLKLEERAGTISWTIELKAGEKKTLVYKYERYVRSS